MVNGEISPYYKEAEFDFPSILETERRLDENEYIVIGDNFPESKDSRYSEVGIVGLDAIIGKIPKRSDRIWSKLCISYYVIRCSGQK